MGMYKYTLLSTLGKMSGFLRNVDERLKKMSEQIDTLLARVAEIETVGDSVIEVLGNVQQQLAEALANNDLAMVAEVNDRLAAQTAELAAAITAGTVAADEPPPAV